MGANLLRHAMFVDYTQHRLECLKLKIRVREEFCIKQKTVIATKYIAGKRRAKKREE